MAPTPHGRHGRHDPHDPHPVAAARSLLFVPGNRPERFGKALASGADAVVLDLEDSVPPAEKTAARAAIAAFAASAAGCGDHGPVPWIVRINAVGSAAGQADLAWLAGLPGHAALMVSKTEHASQLQPLQQAWPSRALLPLIESAAGLLALAGIAASPGVLRLVVGHIDFMADTGIRCSDDERALDGLRFQVALHTRANGLAPAVDGVTTALDDGPRLAADTRRALNFGFGGKLCIHPQQIAPVHSAMAPSAAELAWARRVLAADQAAGGQAVQLDGRMVDLPVVLQARATLARARQLGREPGPSAPQALPSGSAVL